MSVVTMTITDTLGSVKFCTLTINAAGKLRNPVAQTKDRPVGRIPAAEQPSSERRQNGKQQTSIDRTGSENAQQTRQVQGDDEDNRRQQRDAGDPPEHGCQARSERRRTCIDDQADDQRQEDQQNKQPHDLPWVDLRSRDQQRQGDGQENDRADHQHHQQSDREGDISLRHTSDLRHERRAGGQPEQQQAQREWFVQSQQPRNAQRQQRRDDEVPQQRENDKPGVSQRRHNLLQRKPQTNLGHARDEEDENGNPCDGREEFSHRRASI